MNFTEKLLIFVFNIALLYSNPSLAASEEHPTLTLEQILEYQKAEETFKRKQIGLEDYVAQLENLAEGGDAEAAYKRGELYANKFTRISMSKQQKWWRLAAELGHLKAMHYLVGGVQYLVGSVTGLEAFKWYKIAAEKEQPWAQFGMGYSYLIGRGVPQHYTKALKWLRLSAAQNHSESKRHIGIIYEKGYSVKVDYVLAHVWYNLAAAQGNSEAVKNRDAVAELMASEQITEAHDKAAKWPDIE